MALHADLQDAGEPVRVERLQCIHLFPRTDKLDRLPGYGLDRERGASPRVAVEAKEAMIDKICAGRVLPTTLHALHVLAGRHGYIQGFALSVGVDVRLVRVQAHDLDTVADWLSAHNAFLGGIAKVFLYDMADLDQIYRIVAFFVLAVFLGIAAWAYQRIGLKQSSVSPEGSPWP